MTTTTSSTVDPSHTGPTRRRSSSRAPGRLAPSRGAGAAGAPPSSTGRRPPSRGSRAAAGRTGGQAGGAPSQASSGVASGNSAARRGASGGVFASAVDDHAQQHIISQAALDDMQSMYAGGVDWAAGAGADAGYSPADYQISMPQTAAYPPNWESSSQAPRQAAAISSQLDNRGSYQPAINEQAYPTTSSGTAAPPLLSSSIVVTPAVLAAAKRGFVPIGTLPVGGGVPAALPAAPASSAMQPSMQPSLMQARRQQQQQLQQPQRQQHTGYDAWQFPDAVPPPPPPLPPPDRSLQHWLDDAAALGNISAPTEQRSWGATGVPEAQMPVDVDRVQANASSSQQPAAAAGAWQEQHATGRRRGIGDDQLQVCWSETLWALADEPLQGSLWGHVDTLQRVFESFGRHLPLRRNRLSQVPITGAPYHCRVARTLARTACWALGRGSSRWRRPRLRSGRNWRPT
jgi:hypothetical protein